MKPWEKFLKEHYFDPSKAASYSGPQKLIRYLRQNGYQDVTYKTVIDWLKDNESYSLHQRAHKPKKRSKVVVEGIDSQWDIDLMDVGPLAKQNDGVTFVLIAIDVFSRYLFARPLKTKTAKEVKTALENIFEEGRQPKICRFDQGKEFSNKTVEDLLRGKGISFFSTQNEKKANYAERVIKTLKKRIYRYITHTDKERYIDKLQDFVKSYNYTYHRSIGMPPASVGQRNERSVWWYTYWPKVGEDFRLKPFKLSVGDHVRISSLRGIFDREYDFRWSGEIFVVRARFRRDGIDVYRLKDFLEEDIKGSFYEAELKKVKVEKDREWKISKVLKTCKRKGKKEHLVRWLHWPKKFDSWVSDRELKSL